MLMMSQYAKVIPLEELEDSLSFKAADESTDFSTNSVDSELANFYRRFFSNLTFKGHFGTIIIYPIRILEVYVVTTNGKSKLFSSNKRLLNYLFQKKAILKSPEIKAEFVNNHFLNFDKIAKLTGATVNYLPLKQNMIDESDIFEKILEPTKLERKYIIPCLHEEKVVVLDFLRTSRIDEIKKQQFQKAKMKLVKSAYNIPFSIHQHIFNNINNF